MKIKPKTNFGVLSVFIGAIKNLFWGLGNLFTVLKKSYLLMSRKERLTSFLFFVAALSFLGAHYYKSYIDNTVLVPGFGGEYTEVMAGDLKYLNPALAQNDVEKSAAKLLFSGLVSVNGDNQPESSLAESWEITDAGRKYIFHLKQNVLFSDGQPFKAEDVVYTIDYIQTPEMKSPYEKAFESVKATVIDDFTVSFELPNAYGPFIYSCNFGVLPAHLSNDEFSKRFVGTGPFQFVKFTKEGDKVKEIDLKRNDNYFLEKPYFEKVKLILFSDESLAKNYYEGNEGVLGLFGVNTGTGTRENYKSSRKLGLILNLRSEKLKDKGVRGKILNGEKFDQPLDLVLTTLDVSLQRQKAEEIKTRLKEQNVNLAINYLGSIKYAEALTTKNYELLLNGFDFGYDRDPYKYWHSSQINAQNYAGWSDKGSDILLEDARMITDYKDRNAKYDQFFEVIKNENLAKFYDPTDYLFSIKSNVKNVNNITGTQASSHFCGIAKWYIREKRVKKSS